MRIYRYQAFDRESNVRTGEVTAQNKEDAEKILSVKGLNPVLIKRKSIFNTDLKELFFISLSSKNLWFMSEQLSVLLETGVGLDKCLEILERQTKQKHIARIMENIRVQSLAGGSLANIMGLQGCFPPFFISMIDVGERSGSLPRVFKELAGYYEWDDKTKRDMQSAVTYPVMVVIATILVMIFAVIFVIPSFGELFAQSGAMLPLPTQLVLAVSEFISEHMFFLISFFSAFCLFSIFYCRTRQGKQLLGYFKLHLPVVGKIYRSLISYRLAKVTSIMLNSGLSLTESIKSSIGVINNPYMEPSMNMVLLDINKGNGFYESIKRIRYFDDVLIGMIETGEETGNLPKMLEKSAEYLKGGLVRTTKQLNNLLEPVLTVIIGIILGILMLAVVLPSFSLMDAI